MIVENDCLILQIFQMSDGETRAEVAIAAYRVGYRDASHFNWEYKSLFGVPPMRDVQRLREEALINAGR